MKKFATVFVLFVFALTTVCGCGRRSSTAGVAVVDLDRIAVALGWQQSFQDAMQQKERELNLQIEQAKSSLEGELKGLQDGFGINLTDEQKVQLNQYTMQANAQIQNVVGAAQREVANYRGMLVNQFREKVRPQAEKVAKARGLGMILTKSDTIFFADPDQDITNAVIDAMEGVSIPAVSPAPQAGTAAGNPEK